jgi:hypothetical protein
MLKTINYNTWDDENYNPKTLNLLPLHYMQVNLLSNHVFITFFYLFLDFLERWLCAFSSSFEYLLFVQVAKEVKS